ncbi:MAG: hypothetical protein CR972_02585 [Candidatus Moraniibacteriota bacterium]|nr:MAG: hypothetical protein CR972_02585 [Candidatus Moranbacteria bacterium]
MLVIPAFLEEDSNQIIKKLGEFSEEVSWIQIDFADETMTDSRTCDLHELIGELGSFNVEVHLMTKDPVQYFDVCDMLGAKRVYFHIGEVESPSAVLVAMDPYDFTKGIVLSPQTQVEDAFTYIDEVDAVQIMTVVPGAQGGEYLPEMLSKATYLRERRGDLWISVDGGVNEKTIGDIKIKSVDAVGVGSALMNTDDVMNQYRRLQKLAAV